MNSDILARLNEPGIWRRNELREEDGWVLQSRIPFEAGPYAGWSASGEAFQGWPAQGPVRGQQQVAGNVAWFVSSYHPTMGDAAVGRLRSVPFLLEGDILTLRVAGGRDLERLRVELVVDGEVVAAASGHNSEIFARWTWNVSAHRGRFATLRIVDDATGGWGHIMVDELEQWTKSQP